MKNASSKVLVALTSLFAMSVSACGAPPESRSPSTTHVESASLPAGYCSADYQARFGWPDPAKAARVCQCESNGNPRVVSRNGLYTGLFQFSRATWQSAGGGDALDPATNSEHAYRLWRRRGWRAWPVCGR